MNRITLNNASVQAEFGLWCRVILLVLLCIAAAIPALAQDATPSTPVTADDINAVAKQMYCPVCENIPLDVCPTDACQQWRQEIGIQLSEGKSPDEIKANFVARYGDRVVGTPEDPTLRALSLVTPWIVAVIAIIIAGWIVLRWRRNRQITPKLTASSTGSGSEDDYRARLEQDLLSRR